ncbi:MAG: phage major capsid protein [Candidatus Binatia bacterium]
MTTKDKTANADDVDRITVPTDGASLEEMLTDQKKMKAVFADKNALSQFISNYARNVLDKDMEIATQVRDETQKVLASWLKENEADNLRKLNLSHSSPLIKQTDPNDVYNPQAMGAKLDNEFTNAGEFFQTIWHQADQDAPTRAKLSRVRNAFSSTVPSEGGFLIPERLRAELLRVAIENSIVRSRARVIPMETLRVPFPAIDSTSNVSSVFGGITAYWTEEAAALTATQARFKRVVLEAKKLTAYTVAPNELLADSLLSFTAFINDVFPQALAFYEDDAFFNGSGVGEPSGFLKAGAAIEVAKETSQAADTILWENIVKMFARMLPQSLNRAVWVASVDTFPQLATMALSVGTGGSAVWLNNGVEGPPVTILGRPVIFTEKAPKVGDAGDINFVDLSYYLIGDRQVMSARSSEHFKFDTDETAFRIIERVDGLPWLQSAITPKNNGDTLSPFVKIAARA